MSTYPIEDWPYTTYFEDTILPGHALTLDVATKYDLHSEYDEAEDNFFFGFTTCVGKVKSDDAINLLIHSTNLLAKLLKHEEAVIRNRQENYPEEPPEASFDVFNQWVEALEKIIMHSENKQYCFWVSGYEADHENLIEAKRLASLEKDDQNFLLPPHLRIKQRELETARRNLLKAQRVFEARKNKLNKKSET